MAAFGPPRDDETIASPAMPRWLSYVGEHLEKEFDHHNLQVVASIGLASCPGRNMNVARAREAKTSQEFNCDLCVGRSVVSVPTATPDRSRAVRRLVGQRIHVRRQSLKIFPKMACTEADRRSQT